jgi:Big-like domain-containing protein
VAQSQSVTTAEDTPKPITLQATDVDSHGLTFSVTSGPTHGSLSATSGTIYCSTDNNNFTTCTANVTYTPGANYDGADSFSFKANDGTLDSGVATVSITVSAVNDPPTANNTSASTTANTSVSVTLSASDVDSPSLTFSIVAGPSHGTLGTITGTACTPNGSGGSSCTASVTYTPASGYTGPDTFTFKANDGVADSNTATASISVTGLTYTFVGFFQPVDNPPVVNTVKAGQAVPEKWQLFDSLSQPVSDPTSFVTFSSYQVSCGTWTGDPTSAIDQTVTGSSGLQYLGSGNWQFNWATNKTWAATCRTAVLTLKDGSTHIANFSFTK